MEWVIGIKASLYILYIEISVLMQKSNKTLKGVENYQLHYLFLLILLYIASLHCEARTPTVQIESRCFMITV